MKWARVLVVIALAPACSRQAPAPASRSASAPEGAAWLLSGTNDERFARVATHLRASTLRWWRRDIATASSTGPARTATGTTRPTRSRRSDWRCGTASNAGPSATFRAGARRRARRRRGFDQGEGHDPVRGAVRYADGDLQRLPSRGTCSVRPGPDADGPQLADRACDRRRYAPWPPRRTFKDERTRARSAGTSAARRSGDPGQVRSPDSQVATAASCRPSASRMTAFS